MKMKDTAVSLREGKEIEPNVVALMVTRAVGLSVVMSFHPATGQRSVFAGTILDVV
jgi:hypothetical protein